MEAIHLADTLHAMGLRADCEVVECCRGVHWIQQAKAQANAETMIEVFLCGGQSGQLAASMMTRAVTFFLRCKDTSRVCAVFDAALNAILAAQMSASIAADKYHRAVLKSGHAAGDDVLTTCLYGLVMPSDGVFGCLTSCSKIDGCASMLSALLSKRQPRAGAADNIQENFVSAEASERCREYEIALAALAHTTNNAKLLMDAIGTAGDLESLCMESTKKYTSNIGITLVRYIEAIELILRSFSLLQVQADAPDTYELAVCAFKKASQLLVSLVSRSPALIQAPPSIEDGVSRRAFSAMDATAPPKYHLYILDLCLWVHDRLSALLLRPQPQGMDGEAMASSLSVKVFSRGQIEDVMSAFHQLTDSTTAMLIHEPANDGDRASVASGLQKLSSALRPSVLNLFLSGLVQTNEELQRKDEPTSWRGSMDTLWAEKDSPFSRPFATTGGALNVSASHSKQPLLHSFDVSTYFQAS